MEESEEFNLAQVCHISTNFEGDTFVGVKSEETGISVCFPIGYRLPKSDKELRKHIVRLIEVLVKYVKQQEQRLPVNRLQSKESVDFPIQAYMSIINDYMQNDYYNENEVRYKESYRGKINWTKTIKSQKPFLQNDSFVYLNYIVRESTSNDESLISLVHEYCVYESFQKMGWLYTTAMPRKPRLRKLDKQMFTNIVYEKLGQTFNEKHKELFNNMIAMINYLGEQGGPQQLHFGTERFEYVWEKLINDTFGVKDKKRFFPKTSWHLRTGSSRKNAALEPDTIMIVDNKIYILDAKYYKYGVTGIPRHLPESTSINKQITYGEYIATSQSFKNEFGNNLKVFNAFLMPYDCTKNEFYNDSPMSNVAEATGDWKSNNKEYERVQGILVDSRFLMHNIAMPNVQEIIRLSTEIERGFDVN